MESIRSRISRNGSIQSMPRTKVWRGSINASPYSRVSPVIIRSMPSMLAPEQRSELMSLIRGRGNRTTEGRLLEAMRSASLHGWRRHLDIPGRPDFTFRAEKVCIFVHGCFWHGCPKCYRLPRTNIDFWKAKVARNRARDRRSSRRLRAMGYKVLIIWECSLRGNGAGRAVNRVFRAVCVSGKAPFRRY